MFTIFYTPECPYCKRALALLDKSGKAYKGYDMKNIDGGQDFVLECLAQNPKLTGFDKNHRTRPIVFYDGQFVGGASELDQFLQKKLKY